MLYFLNLLKTIAILENFNNGIKANNFKFNRPTMTETDLNISILFVKIYWI